MRANDILDHHLASGHVRGWVHRVNGAALRVDVAELRESALFKIVVELAGMDKLVHRVLLDILVHPSINDISLVVVLPANVLLVESLEDRDGAVGACYVGEPAGRLIGVVHHSASRAGRSELTVGVGRARMLGVVAVEEAKVLCKCGKRLRVLFAVGLDDEAGVARCRIVLFRLALDEAAHCRSVVLARLPVLVYLQPAISIYSQSTEKL